MDYRAFTVLISVSLRTLPSHAEQGVLGARYMLHVTVAEVVGDYADSYGYEDEGKVFFIDDKFQGFTGRSMMSMGAALRFHSSHTDHDGDMFEESYGSSDVFRGFMRGGSVLGGIEFGPMFMVRSVGPPVPMARGRSPQSTSSRGPTWQPGHRIGSRRRRDTNRPGSFVDESWQAGNSFRGRERRWRSSFAGHEHGIQHNGAFTEEYEPGPLPDDVGPLHDSSQVMVDFMQHNTQPVSSGIANGRSECRVYSGVATSSGASVYKSSLMQQADEKKECLLCRTERVIEDGVWQDSPAWQRLAHGHRRGGGGGGGRRGPAGSGLEAPHRAAERRQPPDYYRKLYPPGYDGRTGGASSGRAGSFFDF